jgi:hypothetical protein
MNVMSDFFASAAARSEKNVYLLKWSRRAAAAPGKGTTPMIAEQHGRSISFQLFPVHVAQMAARKEQTHFLLFLETLR